MADASVTPTAPAPKSKRRWLRVLGWIAGLAVVLIIAVYFIATSSVFLKGVILPRVSKAVNAEITVGDASISPFKEIVLHNLKVQTTGNEPLVTAPEVRLRYSLMDIMGGNIHVDEMTLTSPTITLVENADGTSNLDPFTKPQKSKEQPSPKPPAPPGKASKPPQIDIRKVALTDATIHKVKLYQGGQRDTMEISKVSFTVENLKNGQSGKLALSAEIKIENNPPAPGTSALLQAKINGSFDLALAADLKPSSVKGNTHLEVTRAEGGLSQAATLAGDLDCDVTPTDIKQVALRFQRGGVQLGQVRISGPFDPQKSEGRLSVEVLSIDKKLLNIAGAKSGIDFGTTTLNSTNQIELAKAGSSITASGQLSLNQLQLIRTNQATPTLDLGASYNVTIDTAQSNAVIHMLTLTGLQQGKNLLKAELSNPMTVAWGGTANAVGDSSLNVVLTGFNLADWQPFLGPAAPTGVIGAQLKLLSQQAGKQLTFDLSAKIENLAAAIGSNPVTQATVTLQANGTAADLKQFKLGEYKIEIAQQNQVLVSLVGSGSYDLATTNADILVTLQAYPVRLLQLVPQPNVSVTAGMVELKGRVRQLQNNQTVTGSFILADLTGKISQTELHSFGATADLDITMTPQQIQINKISGKLSESQKPGGSFDLSGNYNLTDKSAQFIAKLTDFNQNGLRAFLEPALADKKLVSVALNANASLQYDPKGASSMKGDLQVTNLVVSDPQNRFPATPLRVGLVMDASIQKSVTDVRQFQIALTPTARATNSVQLSGQIDMSDTNAIQGSLKLAADSLDLTSYYDLFAGQTKTPSPTVAGQKLAPAKAEVAKASASAGPEKEAEAKQLPLRKFTADLNIRRIYLHEVEIGDLQSTTKIDGGHVVVNPFKLTLNGAPASSTVDLDMGVPGYKYDLALNAKDVPLAPFVNTFQPARKGQVGGTFGAQAKLSGVGTTGDSLQKNLNGQFDFASTNLNLSVIDLKSSMLKLLVNVVAGIPELISNPIGTVGNLVSGLFSSAPTGGLADDLQKSPLNTITARGTIGSGVMTLQQAVVESPAFRAEATGTLTLNAILTNSTIQIPVSVYLSRPIASRLNLATSNTDSNAYVKLPDFFAEKGTVGKPAADINKLALAGLAAKSLGNAIPALGGKAGGTVGGLIQDVGGLLGGRANTNAPSATNPAPTNNSAIKNLLKGFLK